MARECAVSLGRVAGDLFRLVSIMRVDSASSEKERIEQGTKHFQSPLGSGAYLEADCGVDDLGAMTLHTSASSVKGRNALALRTLRIVIRASPYPSGDQDFVAAFASALRLAVEV
ncbi:MAG TPA: hypothetical protein VEB03_01420 [Candidatus Nanoarchaeia archaeon]|nr:hypothetical protein [Candidatus Nanoarchaeia archaeon]